MVLELGKERHEHPSLPFFFFNIPPFLGILDGLQFDGGGNVIVPLHRDLGITLLRPAFQVLDPVIGYLHIPGDLDPLLELLAQGSVDEVKGGLVQVIPAHHPEVAPGSLVEILRHFSVMDGLAG